MPEFSRNSACAFGTTSACPSSCVSAWLRFGWAAHDLLDLRSKESLLLLRRDSGTARPLVDHRGRTVSCSGRCEWIGQIHAPTPPRRTLFSVVGINQLPWRGA